MEFWVYQIGSCISFVVCHSNPNRSIKINQNHRPILLYYNDLLPSAGWIARKITTVALNAQREVIAKP